jgi:hypothetical protein
MKCPSCGADISADAASCMYCNSSVPTGETHNRRTTFARLRASEAFAVSGSPERVARLPKVGTMQKAFLYLFFTMFIGAAVLMCVMALGIAGVAGAMGGAAAGGPGVAISIVPLLFTIFPIGFIVLGVILFRRAKGKMDKFENDPAQAIPVIVIDKRTDVWGGSGDSSAKTNYYVTCETEDGSREEYQLWDGALYGKLSSGDAGILFVRSNYGLDFDRVRM